MKVIVRTINTRYTEIITIKIPIEACHRVAGVVILTNGQPLVKLADILLVQSEVVCQHILVEDNVGYQLEMRPLVLRTILAQDFSHIRQLRAVLDQVRIFLGSCSASERISCAAVPDVGSLRIPVEAGRYSNGALWHGERPYTVRQCCQLDGCSSRVVRHHRCTASNQHALVRNHLHINGLACLGTTCGLADVRAVVITIVLDSAAFAVGQLAHIQAIARHIRNLLTYCG